MAHREINIAVLGAGLAGIEVGRRLKEQGIEFTVLEKEARAGGLCRTMQTESYHWDLGLHAMYSRHSQGELYYRSLPLDYLHHKRNVKIYHSSKYGQNPYILDYPFELGINGMPLPEKIGCLVSTMFARLKYYRRQPNSLKEWISYYYGPIMARYFMLPYNRKIWNCPLSQLSTSLVSSRVEPSPFFDLIKAFVGGHVVGRPHQSQYLYPRRGIQELIDHSIRDIMANVRLNTCVRAIQRQNYKWVVQTSNGTDVSCDAIISTIPLVEVLKMVSIDGLQSHYDALKWNNTCFVMIALERPSALKILKDAHWVFFKKDEIFYRISMMNNLIGVSDPIIVAEITEKDGASHGIQSDIENRVVDDLVSCGVINSVSEVNCSDVRRIEYTYPIPTVGLLDVKTHIKKTLASQGIFLFGRNGNWEYLNMDDIILSSREFIISFCDRISQREFHHSH